MDFKWPEEVEKFAEEVREFVKAEWHPDPSWNPVGTEKFTYERQFMPKLATKGWLAAGFPKEFGGSALPLDYQYVLHEELSYNDCMVSNTAVGIVAPTLARIGTEEQKKRFIPRCVSGEIEFCLGYTEPGAGSDLASLQLRAVQDGDDFVLNGNKIFTTKAHRSDYVWLAARTDPNVPKHKGISLFIVDINSPGITINPLITMGEMRTNSVYYEDVRVPKENLIGELNRGWYYMATALDFERVAVNPVGPRQRAFDDLVAYVKETERNGKPLKDDPDVRERIAKLSADLELAHLISLRTLSMMKRGEVPNYEASMLKMWLTELSQRMAYWATQIMGHYGTLVPGAQYAPFGGEVERDHRAAVIGTVSAGSNEIQRNIIAQRGLGLPR